MATETNGTTTIYDVLKHTGTWLNAVNASAAHEENNFRIVVRAGGTVNGEADDQEVEFPIAVFTGIGVTDGELMQFAMTFELMSKSSRYGVWSETVKTMRDGVVQIFDGGTLLYTMDYEIGDLKWEEPADDRVIVRSRGVIRGSRKGAEQPGSLSLTVQVRSFTDGI